MKVIYKSLFMAMLMSVAILPAADVNATSEISVPIQEMDSKVDSTTLVLTPNDWEYKGLQTLVKHGAIVDTHGIVLGENPYTLAELLPLLADAVEEQKNFNENDRNTISRLETKFAEDIRQFRREREIEKIDAERAQKEEQERGRNSNLTLEEQERYARAEESTLTPRKMSQAEIDNKMKNFKVDDSRVKVNGDVRIRYTNNKEDVKNSRTDLRTRIETRIQL